METTKEDIYYANKTVIQQLKQHNVNGIQRSKEAITTVYNE